MRAHLWLPPIFAALGACGAHARSLPNEPTDMPTVAHNARIPATPTVNPSPTIAPVAPGAPPAHPQSVGQVENAESLHRFFEALAKIDDGTVQSDVRIIQLGDSHTAADIGTNASRKILQARFGDGGRGFVAIGRPWKTYAQEGVRGHNSRDWLGERGKWNGKNFTGDGMYGLAGYALTTTKKATLSSDIEASSSNIELAYLDSPSGGSFDVAIDGAKIGHVTTRDHSVKSGFSSFAVPDGPHHIEITTNGDGTVRMFGASLDRALDGITFDALGINGERAINLLDWNEAHFSEQLRHRDPQLVVLAYGTNESGDSTSPAELEATLVEVLGRIARAVPSASCLMIGPQDRAARGAEGWTTMPKIIEIIETQKRVAKAAGCGYFDQFAAMGGAGSMASWATESPPRGRGDRTHLTRGGYIDLGNAFGNAVITAYDAWRLANGMSPTNHTLPVPGQPAPQNPPPSSTAASPFISYPLNL